MRRAARPFALSFLVLMLSAPSAAAQEPARTASPGSPTTTNPVDALVPGDVVRLRIWREPELSGDFTVDEHGVVTLPKIGPMQVAREPVDTVRARVLKAYETYLRQAAIEVIPLRRIRVTGAVKNPGLYTVDPTMTIADAVALAGGATPQGRRDRVLLVRGDVSIEARLSSGNVTAAFPLRSGDHLFVPERSWVSRNPGVLIGAVSAAASVIWAIGRLRR